MLSLPLHAPSELATFDTFAREQIGLLPYQVPLPEEGSVFDYWLDLRQYRFLTWVERSPGKSSRNMSGGYVILPDVSTSSRLYSGIKLVASF